MKTESLVCGIVCRASLQDVKLLKKTFLELHQEKEESIKNQEANLTETEALRLDLFSQLRYDDFIF